MASPDDIISRDQFAYEPEVTVRPVWLVECDGGCDWTGRELDPADADVAAGAHRDWHSDIIGQLEGWDGSACTGCGDTENGPILVRPRHGGKPYISCSVCGEAR